MHQDKGPHRALRLHAGGRGGIFEKHATVASINNESDLEPQFPGKRRVGCMSGCVAARNAPENRSMVESDTVGQIGSTLVALEREARGLAAARDAGMPRTASRGKVETHSPADM
ncbi:hypothetical protein [Paraburkholderia dipogonis]|uniref:hypothetical protein n=1 Tax=Paraburkholderia dipogonis TaxID=1211383 RepID=UPI00141B08C0|nr:hypothetical protein [Paraburkholderia dipogonis]